jgi:hypothetical protein
VSDTYVYDDEDYDYRSARQLSASKQDKTLALIGKQNLQIIEDSAQTFKVIAMIRQTLNG